MITIQKKDFGILKEGLMVDKIICRSLKRIRISTLCTQTCRRMVPVQSPASKAGPPSLTCLTNMVSIGSSLFLCFPKKKKKKGVFKS